MKLTSRALIVAAAALQGSLLVAGDDYVVRTYTTEEPSVIEYTTAYETPCTTQLEYPEPPKYETETVTETYTEPGKTIKKYKTVTKTKTLPAETRTVTSTYSTTTTEVYKKTIYKPVTYTATATVTNNFTDTVISRTTDIVISRTTDTDIITSTIVSEATITRDGTPIPVPTTIVVTQSVPSPVTLPAPPPEIITEESTVTLPASTITTTIVQSGTTITTEITLPPSIIVQTVTQAPDTVTIGPEPASTVVVSQPAPPAQTVTVTVAAPPETITETPPPPSCSVTGLVPASDAAGCDGRSCQIEFGEEAAVWWSDYPTEQAPPLRTAITFINTDKRQTCITTSCNTELFNQFYASSRTACVRPPCPSNSLNHDCSIVVGPLVLPNSQTTSVTQVGASGWNLRLGPTATANDIGLCGTGVRSCVTATSRALETPLIYVGDVIPVNNTGAAPTQYILPQIGEYFPPGDPFGACETATLNSLGGYGVYERLRLRARQEQQVIDAKVSRWKGANQLIRSETSTVSEPESANLPSSTQSLPSVSAQPTTTETVISATPPAPGSSQGNTSPETATAPAPPTPTSSAQLPSGNTQVNNDSSSQATPDTTQPGTTTENISGTMVVTDTVYYSMVPPPNEQRIFQGLSSLQSEDIGALPSESLAAIVSSLVNLGGATTTPEAARRGGSSSGSDSDGDDSSGGGSSTGSGSRSGNGTTTQTGAGEGLGEWRTSALGLWFAVVALLFAVA